MNTKIAVVFPGQGSQSVGMLKDLAAEYSLVQNTFQEASQVLGYDLWALVQNGPEAQLNQTEFTQPALLATECSMWKIWQQKFADQTPSYLAGHSLGEYSALVCAGSIAYGEAISLVQDRGRYMQNAYPANQGGMVAVVGLENELLENICAKIGAEFSDQNAIAPANFNSLGQTVLSGKIEPAKRAVEMAKAAGAKLAVLLPVSVPSHCELMHPAAERLANRLSQVEILSPKIPIIHNYSVCAYAEPAQIREALIKQLTSPVRWVETINFMLSQKAITKIIECGPGKVLTGLNKRISKDPTIKFITFAESLL